MFSLLRSSLRTSRHVSRPPIGATPSTSARVSPAPPRRLFTQQTFQDVADRERAIYDKLAARFQPSQLSVQDVSGGCGTFYAITVASKAFQGASIVKQHRMVNEELKEVIKNIHGLQLKTIPE